MIEGLIGLVSGVVTGFGMGGGTILILLVSIIWGIDQHVAQSTNLVFFVPTAIASIITNIKQKCIDYKLGITIGFFGIIGSIIGAQVSIHTEASKLKKYFAIFLIIIAIFEIYSLIKEYKILKKSK